jgi:hypothetical protein
LGYKIFPKRRPAGGILRNVDHIVTRELLFVQPHAMPMANVVLHQNGQQAPERGGCGRAPYRAPFAEPNKSPDAQPNQRTDGQWEYHNGRKSLLLNLEGQRPDARAPDQCHQATGEIRSEVSTPFLIIG